MVSSMKCLECGYYMEWAVGSLKYGKRWVLQIHSSLEDFPPRIVDHPLPCSSTVSVSRVSMLCHVRLFVTPWTVAHQATLPMEFSREEYWSGLPCPTPGDCPNPGIKPGSPALAGGFFNTESHRGSSSLLYHLAILNLPSCLSSLGNFELSESYSSFIPSIKNT